MIKLGDTFFLMILIDGAEIPVERMGFDPLQMHSNVMFAQPMARIMLADIYGYFEKNPLADGSKVDIYVGRSDSKSDAYLYRFRVFKFRKYKNGKINNFDIFLTFNCPRYFNENSRGSITGSSTQVLQQISTLIGVNFVGDQTSDAQTWLSAGQKRCEFAKEVALHGYATDQSCMVLGLTLLGQLRYKDLSAINITTTKNVFVQGSGDAKNSFRILGRKEVSKAGFFNNLVGYKMETVEQNPTDVTNHSSVKVVMGSAPTLQINKVLNDRLEGSRVVMTPIDSGNTHPNYYKAEHQNTRIKATYAMGMQVVTDQVTGLDLFDPVKYIVYDNATSEIKVDEAVSGGYIIIAKTIFATKSGKYYEKFELARQGYNFTTVLSNQMTAQNSAAQ